MLERVGLKGFGDRRVDGVVRRPAPARGDRPLPRARAHARAPRRAARRARSQAARAYEDRAEAAAGHVQHHLRLHHARPVRGAGDVRSHRRDEPGPVRAGREARASSITARATPFVASFVGETNRWQGQAASACRRQPSPCACPLVPSCRGEGSGAGDRRSPSCVPRPWRWRSDQSSLASLPNRFDGRVSAVLFDGAASSLLIDTAGFDQPVRAVLPQAGPLAGIEVGAPVHVGWTARCA